jgi:aminopeptidase S
LADTDRKKIMLYLNVDMVASPNAGYFVQGGTGEDRSETGSPGSDAVGQVLADQLKATGVTAEKIKFTGDDETAFIEAGIPTGGAENGDEENKTPEQAKTWGGRAGEAYDHCYHSACDSLTNVNRDILNHNLRAVAGTVGHFAAISISPAR